MWWIRELLASIRFLTIRGSHPFYRSKRVYEIFLPAAVTLVIFLLLHNFPLAFSGDFLPNLTANIFQFMVFVVPFHLAALGAFATFERKGLDDKLAGTNAEIRIWSNEEHEAFFETLSLRQYASLLFGYLCTIGVLYIAAYIVLFNVNFSYIAGKNIGSLKDFAIICVLFFISHYGFLSIYSITFLFEKINKIGEKS